MRRLKFLINEARKNTNTEETENISDFLCASLLNRAQDFIQSFLYTQNIENRIFRGTYSFQTQIGVESYDLPAHVFARNSINAVTVEDSIPLPQISEKARTIASGYFCADSTIVICPTPNEVRTITVSYTKKLPTLQSRYGQIIAKTGTTLQLDPTYKLLSDVDDYFSVVDANGEIIVSGLPFTQATDTLTVASTTGISVGQFVIPGVYSTDKSQLPDECESALIYSLEAMIQAKQSSKDLQIASTFSEKFLANLADMFADSSGDSFQPPITKYSEWMK